jgi:hypothetical protein
LFDAIGSHERSACEVMLEAIGAIDVSLRVPNGAALQMLNHGASASSAARRTQSSRSATSPAQLARGEGDFVH